MKGEENLPISSGGFATTQWTQVLDATGDDEESRAALSRLCQNYYEPVLVYLRRSGQIRAENAEDIAHDFFAELLSGAGFRHLDREKGRFRSYLLGALKHFLSHQRSYQRAQKRGGGAVSVSLNETGVEVREGENLCDRSAISPDASFDRQWALTVLDRALTTLEDECETPTQKEEFRILSPWLTGEAEHGDQAVLAETLGVPSNTLKSVIHRLRRKFRCAVKEEIGQTLIRNEDVENEMTALFDALSS